MEGEGEFETIINQLDPAQDRLRLMELEDNEQRQSEARQQQLALLEATLQGENNRGVGMGIRDGISTTPSVGLLSLLSCSSIKTPKQRFAVYF